MKRVGAKKAKAAMACKIAVILQIVSRGMV
jgi:hypothetical protein